MSDIIEEQGGVMAMGIQKAIRSVRDIFSAVERGGITTAQAAKTFGESFNQLASAMVESGGIASKQFVELITLAERFGTTAETIKFVGEQSKAVAEGLAAMFGPTIEASGKLAESIEQQREKLEGLTEGTAEYNQASIALNDLLSQQNELGKASAGELEDLGLVAVASFESALAAGMSFTDAVKAHGPAIDAVITAQENLGITTDNVALRQLAQFRERVEQNKGLVAGVEALDGTMLALSRTGTLNAETLGAMERQGLRMYEKLIDAGFDQNEAIMLMGPSLKTMMEAHMKLGIPIDKNTEKLFLQAKEAGLLEDQQKKGWSAIEIAVDKLITKMDSLISRLGGVKGATDAIPRNINITTRVNYKAGKMPDFPGMGDMGLDFMAQHGGIVTRPSVGLVGEAGPEAIIPLSKLEMRDEALLSEVRGLRNELRRLPIHLRDAIIFAQ